MRPSRLPVSGLHLAPVDQLVYEHEGRRIEVRLANRPVSLGRSPEADHQLPSKAASRIHAQVFLRDDAWHIEDLGSSNGTVVNGIKIDGPVPLYPNDLILLADIKLKYEGQGPKPKGPPDHLIARLVYTAVPGGQAREFVIRDKVTIGRKPDNTLQLDIKAVSSHHCEVTRRDGAYILRDLESSNGTFVGDTQVREHTLRNGDVITVGKAVKVYFIDPAGPARQVETAPAAPQAAPAPDKAETSAPRASAGSGRRAPLAAGGASDRGVFEPVSGLGQARAIAPSPWPHLAVGVGLGAVFLVAGLLVAGVIRDARKPRPPQSDFPPPIAASSDVAFSFEGAIDSRGNPEGWTASFEAPNRARAELASDPEYPFDGERSLRVSCGDLGGAVGTLILQTSQARSLDTGGQFKGLLRVRGEGVTGAAVALSVVGEKGEVRTLAVSKLADVKSAQWTEYALAGAIVGDPPASGRLRLMISGNFTRLWLDRFELGKGSADKPQTPLATLTQGEMKPSFGRNLAAEVVVANSRGLQAAFVPKLLAADNRVQSEPELWCVDSSTASATRFRALMPRRGELREAELRAETRKVEYFPEQGLRLSWKMTERGAANFALEVQLPLPDAATIVVADRQGAPLVVDRAAVHAYPYATISELAVNETDFALAFPQGAVAWLDFSRRGVLGVVLRSGPEEARNGFVVDVFSKPVMFARLYDRLFKEGERLFEVRNFAAAEARYAWLAAPSRAQRDLPVIGRATDRIRDINEQRVKLRARVDAAWNALAAGRGKAALETCEGLIEQYLREFRADEACAELRVNLEQVRKWLREAAAVARPPDKQKEAEAFARGFYEDALAKKKEGNLLLALVLAENVIRDYSDTAAYRDALALHDEIRRMLADPAVRDQQIDAALAKIDEEIKFGEYARARKMCHDLFKRFPDTPRTRDIMLRMRKIDQAFEK